MPLRLAARQVITLFLVATLIPAPGLAWPGPVIRRSGSGAETGLLTQRAFLQALNSTGQAAMTGPNRPQLYLVFTVNVAVPPGGPVALTADVGGWMDQFMKEVLAQPILAAAPADSILDDIDASDAHVRSLESATKLSTMPDSVALGDRSTRIALYDALSEAGFDNSGSFRTGADGTVTYEDSLKDGDISVRAREVDGRVVLIKEFKPAIGTGSEVGDPVQIRGTGAPDLQGTQTGGIQISGTQSTLANNTVTGNTAPPAPAGVTNTPVAPVGPALSYNDTLRIELERKLTTITRDDTPTGPLLGLVLTRDTYISQLNATADTMENLLKDPAQLDSVVRGLRRDAKAVDDAYVNMVAAETTVGAIETRNRVDLKALYEAEMRAAQQREDKGDLAGAVKLRDSANDSAYGLFVSRQQLFYEALDQNPLLGLGDRGGLFSTDFLFKKMRNTLSSDAPNSEYVELVRPYLVTGAAEAREEATRVTAIDEAEDFTEFGGPKYERTRQAIGELGDANGSTLPRTLVVGAAGWYEQVEGASAVSTAITNFGLNVVAGTAWVIPVVGPWVSAGAAAIQVVRDGNELVVAVLDANDARNLATVTGYTRVLTAEEKLALEKGEFAVSLAATVVEGVQAVRVVRGPVRPGAGNAAADATTAATNTTADATGAGARNTPPTTPPVAAGAPPAAAGPPPVAQPTGRPPSPFWDDPVLPPVRDADGKIIGPGATHVSTAEQQAIEAADAAELKEIYDANLTRARAAGVPEDRIKKIIGDGDVDVDAANTLYREAIDAEGKQLTMPRRDYIALTQIDIRRRLGTLTPDDYEFLRQKLAADPNYLDWLPKQGRLRSSEPGAEFDPVLTTEQRDALLKDPQVGQMVDDARKAAAARPAAPPVATTTGSAPPGVKPASSPTRTSDPNRTTLDPNTTTIDPNTTTLDPNTTRLDPTRTTVDPNRTYLDPNKTVITPPNAASLVDPNATVRMTDELILGIPKARLSGTTPQQMANSVRGAMSKLGVGPQQLVNSLRQRLVTPRPVSMLDLGNAATAASRSQVDLSLEALGVSGGDAFTVRASNGGAAPVQVQGDGIVVEPVRAAPVREGVSQSRAGNRADAQIAATPQVVTQPVEAFCLERERPVAPPGTQYRVAPPAMQAQHRRLVDVLHAAKRVMDVGGLRPDSEIKGYFNFIRQWSIWTRQENFDEKRFTEAFVEQTRKNVEGQGVTWTDAMRDTVRKVAPGRWRDVTTVLGEVMKVKASAGTPSPVLTAAAAPHSVTPAHRRRAIWYWIPKGENS